MPHAALIHFGCHPVQLHVPIFAIRLGPRLRLRLTRRLGLRLTLRLRLRLGLGLTLRLGLRLTLRLGLRLWRRLWPLEIPDTLHVIIEGPSRRLGEIQLKVGAVPVVQLRQALVQQARGPVVELASVLRRR
jgi:hypothetical protein